MDKFSIKIRNVTKSFKIPQEHRYSLKSYFLNPFKIIKKVKLDVLKDVSLQIKKGEFVGVIGKNGSGKSTLLKLISGIYLPDKGKVDTKGKILPFLELGVGFHPDLSGRENVFLNGVILGMSKKYLSKKFNEIVSFAEVEDFIDLPLKNYSSGMKVRLGFANAIQAKADIYIVDEVLSVGDLSFQKRCIDKFKQLKKQGKTVIFVSHNMSQIEDLCDRVVLLDRGKILADGEKDEVIAKYYETMQGPTEQKRQTKDLEAWIDRVEFFDKDGRNRTTFKTGENIVCRLYYEAREKIIKPTFGVALHKSDGTHVSGPNTRTSGVEIPFIKGTGHIDFVIKNNPLLGGRYLFTVALFDFTESKTYDWRDKEFMFEIEENDINQFGLIKFDHEWRIGDD